MKHREMDCWVSRSINDEKYTHVHDLYLSESPNLIKAKLIVPAEPETLNFEWDFTNATEKDINWLPLLGRRWHCMFREIV